MISLKLAVLAMEMKGSGESANAVSRDPAIQVLPRVPAGTDLWKNRSRLVWPSVPVGFPDAFDDKI